MYRQKSFFFPLLLIAAGVLWLLVNLNRMPAANLWALTHIWPYLLIALGASLILQGQWPEVRPFMSLLIVAGLLAAVFYAPQLGWDEGNLWRWDIHVGGSISGSGNIETETRELGNFETIELRYPAQVEIRQGASPSVSIQADDNLLGQISTRVRNGTLIIDNDEGSWSNRINPSRTVIVTITVVELEKILLASAGNIEANGLEAEHLQVVLAGAGNISLKEVELQSLDANLNGLGNIAIEGRAVEADIEITGSGNFEGRNFATEEARVRINGLGSATLRVSDVLDAQINGAGSVHYYGSPSVSRDVNGLGSIERKGE